MEIKFKETKSGLNRLNIVIDESDTSHFNNTFDICFLLSKTIAKTIFVLFIYFKYAICVTKTSMIVSYNFKNVCYTYQTILINIIL